MNNTVMIESKNHKHANTYGGRIYASDFAFMSLEGGYGKNYDRSSF